MVSKTERLDELNAQTLARRNSAGAIRRAMESQIEAKARRRRKREAASGSGKSGLPRASGRKNSKG
jgi:hypothetical protein